MYVGTHYNSYYNTLFGNKGSVYGGLNAGKINNPYLDSLLNIGTGSIFGKNNIFNPVSSKGLQYVFDLKAGSSGLNASLASLSSGSAFGKTAAVSSNREVMTVTGGSGALSFNSFSEVSVQIDQTAKGQINRGAALQAGDKSSLSGTQRFSIEAGGRSYEFSVNAAAGDTNKDIQQKMASAINAANIGVSAAVVTDDNAKTSALQLSAAGTGENEKSMFTIKDISGNAVAVTGAANTEQKAQNALFSINGGALQSSQSNTVSLGNGVTATLIKAGTAAVSRGRDTAFAESKVNEFVDNYNKLYGAALDNANDPKAGRLFTQLVNTSKIYASKLAGIGIEFDGKGYMKINEEQFKTASENGKVEQFFTENRNTNFGYTNQLSRIARQVQNNTAGYVSRSTLTDSSSSLNSATDLLSAYSDYNYMGNSFAANIRDFIRGTGIFESSGLLFDMLL